MASGAEVATGLTPEQRRALFDILTHHETYAEIESFKQPDTITKYGYPFARTTKVPAAGTGSTTPALTAPSTPRVRTPVPPQEQQKNREEDMDPEDMIANSSSPLLHMLLNKFVLPIPGVRDLPRDFWAVRVQGLLVRLGESDLSESYDKGTLGTRKTLATGSSAVVEMLGRGALGGVPKAQEAKGAGDATKEPRLKGAYDSSRADEQIRAWNDIVQELVYGDLVDDMFDHLSKTEDMESHSPAVKAAVEYSIVHLATFAHRIFILSPEGQYLLKLWENVHNLVPFKMVKQTLRVGNAASMINGMVRLLLAKLSVTSVTNWFGLTQNPDDGMNLLQRIISLVLSWDSSEFKKSAERVERAKEKPTEQMLQAIRQHVNSGRQEHDLLRSTSTEHSQSIITAILNASNPELATSMTKTQHDLCLEYYAALLFVRDRDSLTTVFCRQPPDLFTRMIKDGVAAYEPMIRSVHSRVDLREHVESYQGFVDDFIKASKSKRSADGDEEAMASVEDYVQLLRRNRKLLFKWIHALAKHCPDVWEEFRQWTKESAQKLQQTQASEASRESAGDASTPPRSTMDAHLDKLYNALKPTDQERVLTAVDAHAEYLSTLAALSQARLEYLAATTDAPGDTSTGPGVYLARWNNLLDETVITPGSPKGAVRHGRDVKHLTTMGKTGADGKTPPDEPQRNAAGFEGPQPPDVSIVVKELGEEFREVIREVGK